MAIMTEEKALECYKGGIDCSQICFAHGAEKMGMSKEEAYRIAACFGGGMFNGERCGCVTGSLMAIGMKYGHYELDDQIAKAKMMEKKAEFEARFKEAYGSLICKELIKYDVGIPEEMQQAVESGIMFDLCPELAATACEILDDILGE